MTKRKKGSKPQINTEAIPTNLPKRPNWWTNTRLHAGLIVLCCCLLYANTLTHDYTQDDAIVIYDNMFTTEGVSGIPGILKYDTFYGFFKEEGKANLVVGGRYRPLTLILFATGWEFFGRNPFMGHLMNVVWYALTCLVLYFFLLRLLNPQRNQDYVHFVALVTSLLFAFHPLHTEVVANIKGRDEIMTLLGSIAALYYSLRAFDEKKPVLHILAGVLFFLGLMAKENAITFLAVVPLSYYFFRKTKLTDLVQPMLPFVAAAAVFLFIRASIVGLGGGDPPMELMNNPYVKIEGNQWIPFTTSERLATIMLTLGKYIQLYLFPHPLTHDYYPREVGIMQWSDWRVLLSLLLYVGAGIYALVRLPKRDPISYGILVFLATLSIVSNIVFPIGTNMGERFLFMPSVALCFMSAILLWRIANRKPIASIQQLYPALGVVAIVLFLFAAKTVTRNFVWKDNYSLFLTDIKTSQKSAKLLNSAGGELLAQSLDEPNEARQRAMWQEALGHLNKAIKIHPTYKNAYLLMGNAYNYLEEYEASVKSYEHALKLDPNYDDAMNNLGITYVNAGEHFRLKENNLSKAIEYLKKASELRPADSEVLRLLGNAYGINGKPALAMNYLKRSNQIDPKDVETIRLLGVASAFQGDKQSALIYFGKAVELQPNNARFLFDLGTAYFQLGDQENGQLYHDKARAIDPTIG